MVFSLMHRHAPRLGSAIIIIIINIIIIIIIIITIITCIFQTKG